MKLKEKGFKSNFKSSQYAIVAVIALLLLLSILFFSTQVKDKTRLSPSFGSTSLLSRIYNQLFSNAKSSTKVIPTIPGTQPTSITTPSYSTTPKPVNTPTSTATKTPTPKASSTATTSPKYSPSPSCEGKGSVDLTSESHVGPASSKDSLMSDSIKDVANPDLTKKCSTGCEAKISRFNDNWIIFYPNPNTCREIFSENKGYYEPPLPAPGSDAIFGFSIVDCEKKGEELTESLANQLKINSQSKTCNLDEERIEVYGPEPGYNCIQYASLGGPPGKRDYSRAFQAQVSGTLKVNCCPKDVKIDVGLTRTYYYNCMLKTS